MLPILTPDQSRALDQASAERGISTADLMERAGREVARASVALIGGGYGRRAVVVAGKGNNGGDGLVAARHLERAGMGVTVCLLADPAELRGEAASAFRRFDEVGGRWIRFSGDRLARELDRADLAVDAIFGTGFRGRPEGDAELAIRLVGDGPAAVVSVDIPSGVDGASGGVAGAAVLADLTVTFGAHKPGLVFAPGVEHAGSVVVVDIGFPPDLLQGDLWLVEAGDVAAFLGPRPLEAHKRTSGSVLIVAGSRRMTGAAILSASAAYRAGAGLVTLAVPEGILPVVGSAIAEATFLPVPETDDGAIDEGAWPLLAERLEGVTAAAIGPGLSTAPGTAALVRRFVAGCPVPFVLDADGLNAFDGDAGPLPDRGSEAVLTPHAGEFARLFGGTAAEVAADRVGRARRAAAEARAVVLLKGSRTVIADPGGVALVNPTGTPFLATGGTGDVLTGALGALLARGLAPARAAMVAAYVHGLAGQAAGAELAEGTVASDVAARLPLVLAALAARASPSGEEP
jgi:NAD(P)H-hydrate epimerase